MGWLEGGATSELPGASSAEDLELNVAGASVHRERVLLADDNPDMRDYVRRLLAEQYEVETVADGRPR